jgi:hypothetical protein
MFCNHNHPAIAFIGADCPICIVRAASGVRLGSTPTVETLKAHLIHTLKLELQPEPVVLTADLTPAQIERLALVSEEMGEVIQVIGKTLRHGFDSSHPDYGNETNRNLLEHEIGHVLYAVDLLINHDISATNVQLSQELKREKVKPFLHYQE